LLIFGILLVLLKSLSKEDFLYESSTQQPPEVSLNAISSTNSISLRNITMSEYGTVYVYLSLQSMQLHHQGLMQKISDDRQKYWHRVLECKEMNASLTFANLQSNTTYYVYYFGESFMNQQRSEIQTLAVQTKINEISKNYLTSTKVDQACTMIIAVLFMLSLFLFFKKLEEEKFLEVTPGEFHDPYSTPKGDVTSCAAKEVIQNDKTSISWWKYLSARIVRKALQTYIDVPQDKIELESVNKRLEIENREFEDHITCGICCENPREVMFVNCGHIYCCTKCSLQLKVCPLDQKPISKKYKYIVSDKYGIPEDPSEFKKGSSFCHSLTTAIFGSQTSIKCAPSEEKKTPLKEKYLQLRVKNENYKKYFKCIECNKSQKEVMFLDCCHLAYCQSCSIDFKSCPLDDTPITKRCKGFIS